MSPSIRSRVSGLRRAAVLSAVLATIQFAAFAQSEIPVIYEGAPDRDPALLAPLVEIDGATLRADEGRSFTVPFTPREIGKDHWVRLEYTTSSGEPGRVTFAGTRIKNAVQPAPGHHVAFLPGHRLTAGENAVTLDLSTTSPDTTLKTLSLTPVEDILEVTHHARAVALSNPPEPTDVGAADQWVFRGPPTLTHRDYDVQNYDISLRFNTTGSSFTGLNGSVIMDAESTVDGLVTVYMKLNFPLTVTAVTNPDTGVPYLYSRVDFTGANQNDDLRVTLPAAINTGVPFRIKVDYNGTPSTGGFGYFDANSRPDGTPWIHTLSEPYGTPFWLACKDSLDDKMTSTMRITAATGLEALSNGTLQGTTNNGDGTSTTVWENDYPIAHYLISALVQNMSVISDTYTGLDSVTTMPVEGWVYSSEVAPATFDWGRTTQMLGVFAQRFGEYPFINEKYAQGTFDAGGTSMEHQTCSGIDAALITGGRTYESIFAHELGHQWFGDKVTVDAWGEIWLNEGFASYTEAIWAESLGGATALKNYVGNYNTGMLPFTNVPVLNPGTSIGSLFSSTIYRKGMWVLHMLRGVMGDAAFFAAMSEYASAPTIAYGSANTSQFQAICESHYGGSLSWFFTPWLTLTGKPNFSSGFSQYRTQENELFITGVTTIASGYRMPVQIRANLSDTTTATVTVTSDGSTPAAPFVLSLGNRAPGVTVSTVTVDPGGWILFGTRSTINVPLMAHTASLPDATQFVPYSQQLYSSGGTGTKTWTLAPASAPLPTGLSISANTIVGTTSVTPGDYPITLRVTDSAGSPATVNVPVTLRVLAGASSVDSWSLYQH